MLRRSPYLLAATLLIAMIGSTVAVAQTDATLSLNVGSDSLFVQPGESVIIDMNVTDLPVKVNACQAMLGYSSTYFLDPTGGAVEVSGSGPWDELIWDSWKDSSGTTGEIDTAIGVDAEGNVGTQADATIAKITLTAGDIDGTTTVIFRADPISDPGLVESTFFSDMTGGPLWPIKEDSQTITIDGTDPLISIVNYPNPVIQGTYQIVVQASDAPAGLATPPIVTVSGMTVSGPVENSPGTFTYTIVVDGQTSNGSHTITATVTDKAGNSNSDSKFFVVDKNQITGQVQLQSFAGLTRVVTFVATGGVQTKSWSQTLTFDTAVASYTLTNVPAGTTGLSAKTDWNMRRKIAMVLNSDNQAVVDFTGNRMLLGGDINDSNSVNVLDYGIMKTNWYTNDARSDMSGDGVVNLTDYTILKSNWFQLGDPQ